MDKGRMVFKAIVQDAAVRVFEVDSLHGRVWKCDIHWPRGRSRKRKVHNLGLASILTKSMALNLLVPLIEKMKADYGRVKAPLLSTMIMKFLERHGPTVKPETKKWYWEGLKKISKWVGDRPLSDITPAVLEEFKSAHAHTPGATNNSLHVLHTMFEKAVLWGYAENNPVRRVPFLKSNPSRARMFTDVERAKLLQSAKVDPSPYIYQFILWQLNTGMRPRETMGITEPDVDLKHGRVRLGITKTNQPRHVPLNKTAQDIAWRLWHGDGGFLFRGANGQPLILSTVDRIYRRVARRAGVNLRLYDCRHDALSRVGALGPSIAVLQNLAGHRTLAMVSKYLHLSPQYFDPTMEAVERAEVQGIGDNVVTTAPTDPSDQFDQVIEDQSDLVAAPSGGGIYGKSGRGSQANAWAIGSAWTGLRQRQTTRLRL